VSELRLTLVLRSRVSELRLTLVLRSRVSELRLTLVFAEQSVRASPYSGFTKQSVRASTYSGFTKQSVRASPSRVSNPLGLSKTIDCLLTISVQVAPSILYSTRTEQDNRLSFDHISPGGSTPGGQATSVH